MPQDSYADPVFFNEQLAELTPGEKIKTFIAGIRDNAADLVAFRCDPETRTLVAVYEAEIWSALNALQLVATSIRVERSGPTLIVVK